MSKPLNKCIPNALYYYLPWFIVQYLIVLVSKTHASYKEKRLLKIWQLSLMVCSVSEVMELEEAYPVGHSLDFCQLGCTVLVQILQNPFPFPFPLSYNLKTKHENNRSNFIKYNFYPYVTYLENNVKTFHTTHFIALESF